MNLSVKKYQISIGGRAYSIVSDESEEDILASASLVDSLLHEMTGGNAAHNGSERAAVLVSLRLACQVKMLENYIQEYDTRQKQLIDIIDQENTYSGLF